MKKVTQVEQRLRYPITFCSDEEALSLFQWKSHFTCVGEIKDLVQINQGVNFKKLGHFINQDT